jgi:hypothetical protein
VSHWIGHIPSGRKLNAETSCYRRHSRYSIDALHAISQWPEGVAALADLDVFEELQHVRHSRLFKFLLHHLSELLDNIAQYKAGMPDSTHEGVDL